MSAAPARQVWVLRHAKAAPHQSDDHARPLTGRGRRQCDELAAHLVASGWAEKFPATVLVSSAVRARQTADRVVDALGVVARVDIVSALYRADADDVIELVRELPDDAASVVVVGHNPTLEHLVWALLDPDDPGRRGADDGLSTGALAVIDLDASSWPALSTGTGHLRLLYSPKAR